MDNKKILIVDDSRTMCGILKDILCDAGFKDVLEAQSGEEALALYKEEHPDLVLLDIIMPELNGMDVLKEIGTDAKVIILSAVGQESVIAQAKELGALDYIIKPVEKEEVLKKILPHLK